MAAVNLGELLRIIELARVIYIDVVPEGGRADVLWRQLKRNVNQLEPCLQGDDEDSSRSTTDFQAVLHRCNEFLDRRRWYETHHGIWASFLWRVSGNERERKELRNEIQHHCITFLTESSRKWDAILPHLEANIQEILQQQNRLDHGDNSLNSDRLPSLNNQLAQRYEHLAKLNAPSQGDSSEPFTIEWLRDALAFHYDQVILNTRFIQRRTNEQLHNFLASQWLVEKIQAHRSFKSLRFEDKENVKQRQEEICNLYELLGAEWITTQTQEVLQMRDNQIRIGRREDAGVSALLREVKQPGGKKLLSIRLEEDDDDDSEIHVYRDGETLVLVLAAGSGKKEIWMTSPYQASPLYTTRTYPHAHRAFRIGMLNSNRNFRLTFRQAKDVLAFQRALTNYKVLYSNTMTGWSIETRATLRCETVQNDTLDTTGWVQIWEYAPLPELETDIPAATSLPMQRSTSMARPVSFHIPRSRVVPQIETGRDAITFKSNKNPVIVLFTRYEGKLSIFYIPLKKNLCCNPHRCGCEADLQGSCTRAVFENIAPRHQGSIHHTNRKPFGARLHQTSGPDDTFNWNLALFAEPKTKEFYELPKWRKILQLGLDFPNKKERQKFQYVVNQAVLRRAGGRNRLDIPSSVQAESRSASSVAISSSAISLVEPKPPESTAPNAIVASNSTEPVRYGIVSATSEPQSTMNGDVRVLSQSQASTTLAGSSDFQAGLPA